MAEAIYQPLTNLQLADDSFLKSPDEFVLNGAHVNHQTKVFYLSVLKRPLNFEDHHFIEMDDLAVALKVMYDPKVLNKQISFSLDPLDEFNPEGPKQKKVFYPSIIEGTNLGEDMFQADFLMKQISMGREVISLNPLETENFELPESVQDMGLKSELEYHDKKTNNVGKEFRRYWIENEWIDSVRSNEKEKFITSSILFRSSKMKVLSRILEKDSQGKLIDAIVQDEHDPSYKFAKYFTMCYDELSRRFPIFQRMKQITAAIALARWMAERKVQVNMELVDFLYQKQKCETDKIIPRISHESKRIKKIHEKPEKTIEELMREYPGISFNAAIKIESANNMNFKEFTYIQIYTGGVDMFPHLKTSENNNFELRNLIEGTNNIQKWLNILNNSSTSTSYLNNLKPSLAQNLNPRKMEQRTIVSEMKNHPHFTYDFIIGQMSQESGKLEGYVPNKKKFFPYGSPEGGLQTIFGHKIQSKKEENTLKVTGMTKLEAWDTRLREMAEARKHAKEIFDGKYGQGKFEKCTKEAQMVASDIAFNVGKEKFKQFKKFMDAMLKNDVEKMKAECGTTFINIQGKTVRMENRNKFRRDILSKKPADKNEKQKWEKFFADQ